MSVPKIIILDADHKNALAIIRHLGKTQEYQIDVVSFNNVSIGFFSKYAKKKYCISNPKKEPEKYIKELIDILKAEKYLTVIPVSYISFQLCSKEQERIKEYSHIQIVDFEQIKIASSKIETYALAEQIGVPYPKVQNIYHLEDINQINQTFPCVIKAPIELGKNYVEYVYSQEELVQKYTNMLQKNDFKGHFPIIQNYISGEGAGFFAYYKKGELKNYFIHRRIKEYPPTGGASVVCEAYYHEQLVKDGTKILDALNWNGVAMVEFKLDKTTGVFNLMEINAKFWGSLDLALVCGANFPQMLIDDALHHEIKPWSYQHKRFQWILNGDLFYLFEKPWKIGQFIRDLFISENDIWLRDLKPNLIQLAYIPLHYYKKWFK
ncbi:MAG: hypothetical protein GW809_08885 [Bacteroidetes bacterium]|nr:hypothetical protein [Bacteroidota bacterium]NCQ12234.1 hypothetical protein [Bacteroidota bacterium]